MTPDSPDRRRIVVDGSNIATEGRSLPSLEQLDEAIRAFLEEYPGFLTSDITVVVDASFGHRIDPSEVAAFDQAVEHGEMVTPPAGAVGRGDGFILRIAEKSGALVLSNDSFQEFHAERPWLFEPGRLIGGKPVPGVGWIFTPRTPVRGVKSRSVTAKSKRGSKAIDGPGRPSLQDDLESDDGAPSDPSSENAKPTKVTKATKAAKLAKATKASKATKATKATKTTKATKAATGTKATKATKAATATKTTKAAKGAAKAGKGAPATKSASGDKTAKATKAAKTAKTVTKSANKGAALAGTKAAKSSDGPEALNDPMTFLTFVADHPVGSTFDGTVVSFTSHGAHVDVGGMLCHIPLRGMADPPPKKARQVLAKGETRPFVLVSLDAARRRAELALPGIAE